jgi:hypothetical protein
MCLSDCCALKSKNPIIARPRPGSIVQTVIPASIELHLPLLNREIPLLILGKTPSTAKRLVVGPKSPVHLENQLRLKKVEALVQACIWMLARYSGEPSTLTRKEAEDPGAVFGALNVSTDMRPF